MGKGYGRSETRGVAQPGSASALGAEGRWFKSSLPDTKRRDDGKESFYLSKTKKSNAIGRALCAMVSGVAP